MHTKDNCEQKGIIVGRMKLNLILAITITFYYVLCLLIHSGEFIMDERNNKLHLNMGNGESASKCFSYHDLRRLK